MKSRRTSGSVLRRPKSKGAKRSRRRPGMPVEWVVYWVAKPSLSGPSRTRIGYFSGKSEAEAIRNSIRVTRRTARTVIAKFGLPSSMLRNTEEGITGVPGWGSPAVRKRLVASPVKWA